ncbi:MAG: indolepyruvate decarboxylase [Mycobacterium sp.]|nr:indolepyruvate decarboxylase [Mycobacterium sp.]MDT5275404.1 indolepyruvate decarboxylase [Mycobacterium sp.]MDT5308545.1 indolepyruvate decarboxylase [Mycobacterium sp.]
MNSCGVLDDALKTAEQTDGAAYIEVITDAYEAPLMYQKLHENVKSFYNIH